MFELLFARVKVQVFHENLTHLSVMDVVGFFSFGLGILVLDLLESSFRRILQINGRQVVDLIIG